MIKLAICDDNIEDLSNISAIINDYRDLHMGKNKIEYSIYNSAFDLITAMERGLKYDLIFLDILMPLITGMDAAKEIRQFNKDVKIIFLTSSTEFAIDSYSVKAYYYVLKPISKEKLIKLLDMVISEIEIHTKRSFLIKSKTNMIRVYVNKLEFAEVIGRTILYHLTDGLVIESTGSMTELEKKLFSHSCFIKPHRSYIINMEFIDTLGRSEIKMQSFALVPIAKANYKSVKSAYIEFAFKCSSI